MSKVNKVIEWVKAHPFVSSLISAGVGLVVGYITALVS